MKNDFQLRLVDPNERLCTALDRAFGINAVVTCARFEDIENFDCMVSAANSFGLMDGGVDLAIAQFFGPQLVSNVQSIIRDVYCGEQPVGTSFVVSTGNSAHPFLAHTPTMRVPMSIAYTDAVYSAMFAMLLAVRRHNIISAAPIRKLICPGLGTATGKVSPESAAAQMALAYQMFLLSPRRSTWEDAVIRQHAVVRAVGA